MKSRVHLGVNDMRKNRQDGGEPLWKRVGAFLGRQGFYLVLFLCVGVIGLTALIFSSTWKAVQTASTDPGLSLRITMPPLPTLTPTEGWKETLPPVPPETALPAPAEEKVGEERAELPSLEEPDQPAAEVMASVFLWPLNGEVERIHAWDRLVYDRTMADWRTHDGLDISGGLGAKVCAAADGVVEQVVQDERMGSTVVLYHGGGLRSVYANLAAVPAVQTGDEVRAGDVVGAIGTTAMAEKGDVTHLHFAMSVDGVSVDPREYLPRK